MGPFSTYRGVAGVLIICYSSDSRFVEQTDSSRKQRSYSIFLFLYHYCKLKTNFIANCQLLCMGCLLRREQTQKKNPIFNFQNCQLTRECLLTGICEHRVWLEAKEGIWKTVSVSRADNSCKLEYPVALHNLNE